jgi:FlaA1/EpsC-like NDP-sugar epimerase
MTSVARKPRDHGSSDPDPTTGRGRSLRWPALVRMLLDVAILVFVVIVLSMTRYEQRSAVVNREGLALALGLAAMVYLVTYGLLVLNRFRWGSQDELVGLGVVAIFLVACLSAASILTDPAMLPLSVAITAPLATTFGWLLLRYGAIQYSRTRRVRMRQITRRRTVVVGAGDGGRRAIAMMLDDDSSRLRPVALVDDDPRRRRVSIMGVRVEGSIPDLADVCARVGAEVVLLAAPTAPPSVVQSVLDQTEEAGAELLVLPSFNEMLSAPTVAGGTHEGIPQKSRVDVPPQAFRSVLLDDLLGRGVVEIDTAAIGAYLHGRVVLVTGAGGSIGSQLCREIAAFGPGRLVMTDRDDSLLHGVQLSVDGRGLLDSDDLVLGDLRDVEFVRSLVQGCRPDVVFHTAAIKHLTLAERFPAEAFLTNVAATADLLEVCISTGVERFVNISTDKAADPQSILGYSKRVTERLTSTYGACAPQTSRYISVRFGNVLGSRGSALTTFAAQLASGHPLTITSADMTRYFMTVHEAAQLVLQAAVHGRTGEGLILDMGQPHNIEALSRRFAALQGFPAPEIVYTGARPGEKVAERTLAQDEPDHRPFHPLVSHVPVPNFPEDLLEEIGRVRAEIRSGTGGVLVPELLRVMSAAQPHSSVSSVHR